MKHGIIARIEQDKFIPSLREGNIHFSTNQKYKDIEQKFNDHSIGAEEGIFRKKVDSKNLKIWNKYGQLIPIEKAMLTFSVKEKFWISSWIYLGYESFNHYPREKDGKENISLKAEVIERLKRLENEKINFERKTGNIDCSCSLVMMDWTTFINVPKGVIPGFVQYKNDNDNFQTEDLNELKLMFIKPKRYFYQREIRLILPDRYNKDHSSNIFIPAYKNKIFKGIKIRDLNRTHFLF